MITDASLYSVDGLCGYYTGLPSDDKAKPDGKLAVSTKDFGDSWDMKIEECKEELKQCTDEESAKALKMCDVIQSKPFTECHSVLPPASFLKGCVDSLCLCLRENKTEDECRCHLLTNYVTACLEKKPDAKIADWRAHVKCYKDCPHGEKHYDCYKAPCEQSCDTLKSGESCEEKDDATVCMSGCFCEPGLVRKGDSCVLPEVCRDCVCEGYGDPHYRSFDRNNFTFNGQCTYVAARDHDPTGHYTFQVLVRNKLCQKYPTAICTDKISVLYKDKEAFIELIEMESLIAEVEGSKVKEFPFKNPWISMESPDDGHMLLVVPEIQLEASYSKDNYGFTLRLPSNTFLNKLEGLCGNCNGDVNDDMVTIDGKSTTSVDDFGLSWLLDEDKSSCTIFNKMIGNCSIPLPENDPCLKLMDAELFGKCHVVEDPVPYVSSCHMDICSAINLKQVACHSLEAYSRRCAQQGICLDWRKDDLCPKTCPEGMEYFECSPSCAKTCDNYKTYKEDPTQCALSPTDGCFCPEGLILHEGKCVSESYCHVCDEKGHRIGDTWKTSPCETCECEDPGAIVCSKTVCPPEIVCNVGYQITEIPGTGDDCCGPQKTCRVIQTTDCPDAVKEDCSFGKESKLVEAPGVCPVYACMCIPKEECPLPEKDGDLKLGEVWEYDESGCCPTFVRQCTGNCPAPDCPEFFKLTSEKKDEKDCCPTFKCESPKDACIYEHTSLTSGKLTNKGGKGSKGGAPLIQLPEKNLYKIGEAWSDGPCTECECISESGEPSSKCLVKSCPTIDEHPDRQEYVLEAVEFKDQCCPKFVRTSCIENGQVIEVSDRWKDPSNGCRSVECVSKGKVIEKVEQIQSCELDCPLGWEYKEPPLAPTVCCGACEQVACDYEGEIKHIGDEWLSADLCTEHKCVRSDQSGKIQLRSKEIICNTPSEEELEHYEFVEETKPNTCCSEFTRKMCIVDGIPLLPGQEVQDKEDKCFSYLCEVGPDGNVTRKEKEKACSTDCPVGHKYVPALPESPECCGQCKQIECVSEGKLFGVGQKWDNEKDACYTYSCQFREDVLATVLVKKDCPYFNPDCPKEHTIMDDRRCCKICNVTMEKKECEAESIDPSETVGIFVLEAKTVGKCTNFAPISGLKRCKGQCDSFAGFVTEGISAYLNSQCECCTPSKFNSVKVELKCDLGYSFDRFYDNIEACECRPCQAKENGYLSDQPVLEDTEFNNLIHNNENQS